MSALKNFPKQQQTLKKFLFHTRNDQNSWLWLQDFCNSKNGRTANLFESPIFSCS